MEIWIMGLIIALIYAVFMIIGTHTEKHNTDIRVWANDIMLDSGFNPPPLQIIKSKRNALKISGGEIFIYLKESLNMKKDLAYMLAYLTRNLNMDLKKDCVYYNNLEIMLSNME